MRPVLVGLLSSILLLATSGCWDVRDVNNIAFAVTIGIDQPANLQTAKYKVTLEFAEPVTGKAELQSLNLTAEAESISQAVQRIQTRVSRTVSFSHLRGVVIGEAMARQTAFSDLSDYLLKEPEIALRLRLLFVQGEEAHALFHIKPKYRELLASELVAMGELQREMALVRTNQYFNFWNDLKSNNGIAVGSRAFLKDDTITREGAAIFKNWRLRAWLTANEAQAANWLLEKTQAVVVAREKEHSYTYQVIKYRRKIIPEVKDGRISFRVRITTKGMLVEESGVDRDFSQAAKLKQVTALLTRTIQRQIQSAVRKSQQELQIDYLEFGKELKKHQPDTFNSLKWPEVFPKVPVKVEVDCKVRSTGLHT